MFNWTEHFGVALDDVNWLSTVSSFVYVLVFLPAAWLFETTGDLRTGIVVGCWLDLVGGYWTNMAIIEMFINVFRNTNDDT